MSSKHKTPKDSNYKDPDWLNRHYHELGKSMQELSDSQDVSRRTIQHWMDKYGIERRSVGMRYTPYARFETRRDGYEKWGNCESSKKHGTVDMLVHRLLAISEYGVDDVKDNHVHHKNEIPWDNRPENIEILSPSEHAKHHDSLAGHRWKGGAKNVE